MDYRELSARGNAFSHDDEKFAKFCKVEFEESIKKAKQKEKREKRMIELAISRFIRGVVCGLLRSNLARVSHGCLANEFDLASFQRHFP